MTAVGCVIGRIKGGFRGQANHAPSRTDIGIAQRRGAPLTSNPISGCWPKVSRLVRVGAEGRDFR